MTWHDTFPLSFDVVASLANSCDLLDLSGPVSVETSECSFGASCFMAFVGMRLLHSVGWLPRGLLHLFLFYAFIGRFGCSCIVVFEQSSSKVLEV